MEAAKAVLSKITDPEKRAYHLGALSGTRAEQVKSFHEMYNCPVAEYTDEAISHMSDSRIALRLNLILEEAAELLYDGFGIDMHVKFGIRGKAWQTDILDEALEKSGHRNIYGVADALGDLSYVIDGFALEAGIPLDAIFTEIHGSNMTKPGEDGNPIHREDGKVLKGPFFTQPNLKKVMTNVR